MLSKKKSNYKQFIFDYLFSKSTENQLQKMILFFYNSVYRLFARIKKIELANFKKNDEIYV